MSLAENLPDPVIVPIDEDDISKINSEIDALVDKKEFSKAAKMVNIYPLSDTVLDDLKRHYGIKFLLENRVNLYNAIKTYGMAWLEQ